MDPGTVLAVVGTFTASCVAQKCADAIIEAAWSRIGNRLQQRLQREPGPSDFYDIPVA